jgi:glycerol-3-phosphate dehydrogenase subunit C
MLLQSLVEDVGGVDPYSPDFKDLIDLCYACRRCVSVCPAGIPIPDLMSHARYAYLKKRRMGLTLGHRIYANYGEFDRLGSSTAPISNWMLRRRVVRQLMEWATHIDTRALLPPFQRESFESWFRKQPNSSRTKKIVYFVDSYANFNDPTLGKTVVALLRHTGYQVIVPPQKQSGMPSVEYGLLNKARSLAQYNLSQLTPYAREGTRVVCSSPAASYLLKEGYGTILEDSDFPVVSKAVVDIAELLLEENEKGTINFSDKAPEHVDYHYCCLSKTLSLGPVTTKLLSEAGIDYRQIDDCCGGAGVWGTFKENYEMSSEIAAKLKDKVEPGVKVLTESETCRLQIEGHSEASVHFPIEILAQRVLGLQSS